jgi:hypothetical protein
MTCRWCSIGLTSHGSAGIAERAELVAQRLARLILEGIGVDGVETQTESRGVGANDVDVGRLVPRDVERDARRRGR